MTRLVTTVPLALALLAASPGLPARAADTPTRAADAPVELPPMLVEESISSAPWYYAKVDGTEVLSRCSSSTTRDLVEAWRNRMQLLRVLVPDEFLAHADAPDVLVLYSQDVTQNVGAEIQRELKAAQGSEARNPDASRERVGGGGVNIAPSMRLADRDTHATIAYIDESRFDGANLRIAPGHISYLMRGRVPELPLWLVEGVERTWRRADFVEDPITFDPLVWLNSTETDELASDPTRPRALLPANELFATAAQRTLESQHPRHTQARTATQELFFRWAVTSSPATRAALWKFAARAAGGAVTEEIFESYFGFDFAELRDRLSDYLATAVDDIEWIDPGPLPRLPAIEVRRATPNEIARIRGEWERLAIGHVQRRLPAAREPYLAQARRTLRRAYLAGDRDPRLLATLGLLEIDADNEAGAREFLEPAVAGGVVRPRACHELARLRFAELRRDAPETKLFTFTELAPIMQPLQRALALSPPLPEVCELLAEAWARCEIAPHDAEFAELERGARLFARRPTVGYPTALALARHGKKTEAAAVLDACAGFPADEKLRTAMARLRAELAAPARPAADP